MSLIDISESLSRHSVPIEDCENTKEPCLDDKSEITITIEHARRLNRLKELAERDYAREELASIRQEIESSLTGEPLQLRPPLPVPEEVTFTANVANLDKPESVIYKRYMRGFKQNNDTPQQVEAWYKQLQRNLTNVDYLGQSQHIFGICEPVPVVKGTDEPEIPADVDALVEQSIRLVDENRQLFIDKREEVLASTARSTSDL